MSPPMKQLLQKNKATLTCYCKPLTGKLRLNRVYQTFKNLSKTMKKLLFALLGILLVAATAQSQDDGAKLAKSAGKALAAYNQDPSGNGAKLTEAMNKIDQALQTPEAQGLASAWIVKGDVYSTRLQNDLAMQSLNPKAKLSGDNDALEAFTAYKTAYEKPEIKKYEKSKQLMALWQPCRN